MNASFLSYNFSSFSCPAVDFLFRWKLFLLQFLSWNSANKSLHMESEMCMRLSVNVEAFAPNAQFHTLNALSSCWLIQSVLLLLCDSRKKRNERPTVTGFYLTQYELCVCCSAARMRKNKSVNMYWVSCVLRTLLSTRRCFMCLVFFPSFCMWESVI